MQYFSEVVKSQLTLKKINCSQLAKLVNLSIPYVHDLLKGNRRWNESNMLKVCEALGIDIVYTIN